ncbi:condensation domain-containing protein [Spirillospora sp. CA-294931]|uniref:condensation domain-containing protein n=1 Tax=Spirillospora sp. CA-294931 TaxID=3240042 RepID=UPI003D8DDF9D
MTPEPSIRLLPGQVARWKAAREDGWRTSYMSPVYAVPAHVDPGILARALSGVVHRHAPLRTRVVPGPDGSPLATLRTVPESYPLEVTDLAEVRDRELATPVDLATDWPLRAVLAPDRHELFLTLSHVVADGWSLGVLVRELQERYRALSRGLPEPRDQWDEVWAAHVEEDAGPGRDLDWWRARLDGVSCRLNLGPPARDTTARNVPFAFPGPVSEELRRAAGALGATLTGVSLAALAGFLTHRTRVPELLVTVPYAGRHRPEHEPLIGLFNNRLPLRLRVDLTATFGELVHQSQEALFDALEHADTPFHLIEEAVFPGGDASTVQTAVQVIPRSFYDAPGREPGDVSFRLVDFPTAHTSFQFCLDIVEADGSPLSGWMTCQAGVVPAEEAAALVAGYVASARELTRAPDRPMGPLLAAIRPGPQQG